MNRNKCILLIISLILFSAIIVFTMIKLTQTNKIELIQFVNDISTDNLTVLEKMYVDVDNDGQDESIELFTSAKRDEDGKMGWDDGQQWLLLVNDEGKSFPFFDGYVQSGQLEFWVSTFNKSQKSSPEDIDLEKHIFVMKTGNAIQLSGYSWDKQNLCFKKEILFDPPNQWNVISSYKY